MAPSATTSKATDPLKDLLGDVVARLEALESKAGIAGKFVSSSSTKSLSSASINKQPSQRNLAAAAETSEAVAAYDDYMKTTVAPFMTACTSIGSGVDGLGGHVCTAWDGIRTIIVLASKSKMPIDEELSVALQPHLLTTQAAVKAVREAKLSRDYDLHSKAVMELSGVASWVLMKPPNAPLPAGFVTESLGSVEFWLNRIRKEHKGKAEHITFCDATKQVILDLAVYIKEHHKVGLAFNPKGVSLAETAIRMSDDPPSTPPEMANAVGATTPKRNPMMLSTGSNVAGLMGELSKRKSAAGDSAATGLKHVTKAQQTWRKEFDGAPDGTAAVKKATVTVPLAAKKKPLKGLPIFEYQDRGFKWVIENHSKESVVKEVSKDGVVTVEISDPKQQVYMYNCEGITVKVTGKYKSLVLDKCEKCAVVYEDLISSTEVVNCKKIQLQVTGSCPVFTIDKTTNIVVYLSEKSKQVSTFTTSLSCEMNVSYPDGDDQKEVPIPEQFVHKVCEKSGNMSSTVSDLYH